MPEPRIKILNKNVIELRGCPRPSVMHGSPVTVQARIRLRLENAHSAPIDVVVKTSIAKAGEAHEPEVRPPTIHVAPGQMTVIEERELTKEFSFASTGPATLDAACLLEWSVDGAPESLRRVSSCSFAVVEKVPDPLKGLVAGGRRD